MMTSDFDKIEYVDSDTEVNGVIASAVSNKTKNHTSSKKSSNYEFDFVHYNGDVKKPKDENRITETVIDYPVDVKVLESNNVFPEFLQACRSANFPSALKLKSKIRNVNATDKKGWPISAHACYGGSLDILKLLLELGLDIYKQTPEGYTILHIACAHGHLDISTLLIKDYSELLGIADHYGWYPIHSIAQGGNVEIMKLLTELNVDMMQTTSDDLTVMHVACSNAKFEMCKYLWTESPPLLLTEDTRGWGALHFAVEGGNPEIFQSIVNFGLHVESPTIKGMTVLHVAVEQEKCDMFDFLIDKYPRLLDIRDINGLSVAHYAGMFGKISILKMLEQKDSKSIYRVSNDMKTVLHYAYIYGQNETCDYLTGLYPYLHTMEDKYGNLPVDFDKQEDTSSGTEVQNDDEEKLEKKDKRREQKRKRFLKKRSRSEKNIHNNQSCHCVLL